MRCSKPKVLMAVGLLVTVGLFGASKTCFGWNVGWLDQRHRLICFQTLRDFSIFLAPIKNFWFSTISIQKLKGVIKILHYCRCSNKKAQFWQAEIKSLCYKAYYVRLNFQRTESENKCARMLKIVAIFSAWDILGYTGSRCSPGLPVT